MASGTSPAHCINLGLQGGGTHGAFTWGVLDALLEDGRLDFEGVSGTSAGAINAVVLAQGLMAGGREGAREALARFWNSIALSPSPGLGALHARAADSAPPFAASLHLLQQWTQHLSPYEFNPFDLNPLRDQLAAQIDFDRLRVSSPLRLFLAATHANSGKLRLFTVPELSLDTILASSCLPTLQQAVLIDNEPYWDGGYAANPAVAPLLYDCRAKDILLVLLSPLQHVQSPRSADEIRARSVELAFKSAFLQEMRAFAQALRYAESSLLPQGKLERRLLATRFHLIEGDALLDSLGTHSKLVPEHALLIQLRDAGRDHAKRWLALHFDAIGQRSSINLPALFV